MCILAVRLDDLSSVCEKAVVRLPMKTIFSALGLIKIRRAEGVHVLNVHIG